MKKLWIVMAVALLLVLGCDLAVMAAQRAAEPAEESENSYEEIAELIQKGDTDEALELLEHEDKGSAEYYAFKELAYIKDGSDDADEKLAELYYEAADLWPEWQHMQKMAGVAALLDGNYKAATYRLYEALTLDTDDAETWYYMGASAYYQGEYENMRYYFEQALERNLSEEKQAQVLWFAQEVGDRE